MTSVVLAVIGAAPTPPKDFSIGNMRVRNVQANLDLGLRWWRSDVLGAARQWFTSVNQLSPPAPMPTSVYAIEKYWRYDASPPVLYEAYAPNNLHKPPCCTAARHCVSVAPE